MAHLKPGDDSHTVSAAPDTAASLGAFSKRLMITLLFGAFALTLWKLTSLLIPLFGAILLGVGLRAASVGLARRLRIGIAVALGIVIIMIIALFAGSFWFFGTIIVHQFAEVARQVPAGVQTFVRWLQTRSYGPYLLDQVRSANPGSAAGWAASLLASITRTTVQGLGYAVLTLAMVIYLAADPLTYRRMCLRVLPASGHAQADQVFDRTAEILRRWLVGQLIVMLTIGILSGLGLWLLGIDAAIALGLVGGLLTFIPYVGAVFAAVPATLVALTQGPGYAGTVILMYVCIHIVEGNFITPLVQAKATSLPPVLALLSTVAFSLLLGPSAILFAAPLMLFVITAVEVLWVEQELAQSAAN